MSIRTVAVFAMLLGLLWAAPVFAQATEKYTNNPAGGVQGLPNLEG